MVKGVSAYDKTWTNTVGGDTWTLVNFNNNNKQWTYVKCGWKSQATIATIVNNDPYTELITKVVVTYDAVSNVNTTYLEVASDDKFTNAQKIEVKVPVKGDVEYTIPKPVRNSYYRLTVDNKQVKKSGSVQISKITYYKSTVQGTKTATTVSFGKGDNIIKKDADAAELITYSNPATVKNADGNVISGAAVTYSSSDKDHADVDANGDVTVDPTVAGVYTITASYAGDDNNYESQAAYTIAVISGTGTEDDPYTVADGEYIINNNLYDKFGKSVYTKGTISKIDEVSAKFKNATYYISDDGSVTNQLQVFRGKYLNAADFTTADQIAVGDIVLVKGDLTLYNNNPEYATDNSIVKFYPRNITLDEENSNDIKAGHNVTATLKRTFNANAWNTLVLPFNLTAEQISAAFGASAKVAAYTGATANADNTYTLNFTSATAITANVPVFIYGAENKADGYTFTGVEVKAAEPTQKAENFNFVGTYAKTTVPAGNYFINMENKLFKAGDDKTNISATRATFQPTGTAATAKGLGFRIAGDGETTAINAVTIQKDAGKAAYNLSGQRVNGAYKGIVIQNGKKSIQK